jgi:hypothetical protein
VSAPELLPAEEWAQTPTEVALLHADTSALDQASPEVAALMVTKALEESRQWLAVAMRGTDPTPIAEFKAWAATVEEATRQKKLGREIELNAAEMVRRAERGIGVAIRRGQEAGEIKRQGQGGGQPPATERPRSDNTLSSPYDFASHQELVGNGTGIYHMTDDVSDEQFETAIEEAKTEGNLSRANVVRKARKQPAPPSPRPEVLRQTRHHNSNRIVEQTVIALEGLCLGIDLIDYSQVDPQKTAAWAESLRTSLRALNRLVKELQG